MRKWSRIFLGVLLLLSVCKMALAESKPQATPEAKTKEMYIQTDLSPPPSAEEIVPKHPFFAEPTPANEVMDKVVELEERLNKLEEGIKKLEKIEEVRSTQEHQTPSSTTAQ